MKSTTQNDRVYLIITCTRQLPVPDNYHLGNILITVTEGDTVDYKDHISIYSLHVLVSVGGWSGGLGWGWVRSKQLKG